MDKTVLLGLMMAAIAVIATSTAIPMSFADKPESNQDGWSEVTSETATSDNNDDGRANGLGWANITFFEVFKEHPGPVHLIVY